MRRDLKAIYNYCSWEAGRPCGNKQAWILKPTKGRKEGLGSMWNREMEVVPPPISPCTNPGHSKGRYLKQKINQGRAKWKNTSVAKGDNKEARLTLPGVAHGHKYSEEISSQRTCNKGHPPQFFTTHMKNPYDKNIKTCSKPLLLLWLVAGANLNRCFCKPRHTEFSWRKKKGSWNTGAVIKGFNM